MFPLLIVGGQSIVSRDMDSAARGGAAASRITARG